jgi:phospholipid/cholesterol/gamma-HCH transport system substrate-binding protein
MTAYEPRRRITDRLTRSKLTLELRRSLNPVLILGVGAVAGLACAFFILSHIGGGFTNTRPVRFIVRDATGVVPHRAEVRFLDIPAGNVADVKIVGDHAVVTAEIDKRFGAIYRDARAAIRPNTPLQDMYLDITSRGTKAAGPVGDRPLPMSQTDTGTNVSDVLDVFEPDVRAHLKATLAGLGAGLKDRGAGLRWSFRQLAGLVAVVGRLSEQLTRRQTTTRRLVHDVGTLTQVLADHDAQLRGLVEHGGTVLAATADRRADLDATLGELPGTLAELDRSFAALRGILPDVDTAVTTLRPVAAHLSGGLSAVRAVAHTADPAVTALRRPLRALVPLSAQLKPVAQQLSRAVANVRPQTADLAKITRDVAGCPMAAYQFFQFTASLTKYEDAFGVYPRGDFGFAADSVSGVKDPFVTASPSCAPGTVLGAAP